jgi:hypothetical protein
MRLRHADGMTHTRTTTLALAAAALLALTACSSSDDETDTSSAEEDVEQALRDYTTAMNSGDADTVYELNSERCREQRGMEEAEQAVQLINELYGDIEYETIEVTDITEDTAKVNATTGIDALDGADSARWVLEDGQWRNDSC